MMNTTQPPKSRPAAFAPHKKLKSWAEKKLGPRLMVIGGPGSGKTTLAQELARLGQLPLVHTTGFLSPGLAAQRACFGGA